MGLQRVRHDSVTFTSLMIQSRDVKLAKKKKKKWVWLWPKEGKAGSWGVDVERQWRKSSGKFPVYTREEISYILEKVDC